MPDVERDEKDVKKTSMLVQTHSKIKRLSSKFEILNFLHDIKPLNFYSKILLNPFNIYVTWLYISLLHESKIENKKFNI